jgi:hypothetical protein
LIYSNIEGDNNDDDGDSDDNNDDNNDDNDDNGKDDNGNNDKKKKGHNLFAWEKDIPKLTFNNEKLDKLDDEVWTWYTGLKHDPIKCARRIVHVVRSSDQRKQAFKNVINTGNQSSWFKNCDDEIIELRDLELLRNVKTRWDSVYCVTDRPRCIFSRFGRRQAGLLN